MTENEKITVFTKEDYKQFMRALPLLPLRKNGKIPFLPDGHLGALTENNIYDFPAHGYNVGLSLPLAHLCGIDVDENHGDDCNGLAELAELEVELGQLPRTLTQRTPNGGIHLIFTDDGVSDHPIGKLSPSIDFKRQGYIVLHPSMIGGRQYEIIDIGSDDGFHIAQMPQKWLDKVNRTSTNRTVRNSNHKNIDKSAKIKKKIQ